MSFWSFSRLLCGILHTPFVYSSKSVRQIFFTLQESKFASSKYKTNFQVYNFEPTKLAKRRQGNSPLIIPLRLLRSEAKMAKLAKPVGGQKSMDNGNEEGVVSSSSGFLSGDEEAVVTTKGKGRGRKPKKEVIKDVDTTSPQKPEKTVKSVGTGRGRKKVTNEEQTNAESSLDNEVKVQKKAATAAKGRGKKAAAAVATEDIAQAVENITEEAAESLPPVKRGRKAATAKTVATLNENNEVVDVVSAPKGRGRAKKVAAVTPVNDEESTEVPQIAEETSSKSKRQKKSPKGIPKEEEKESDEAIEIVKEDKKRKTTKSTKVKAEPIEPIDEPEPIVEVKATKSRSRQPKEEVESTNEPVAEAIVEAKKTKPRGRQPKQVQKEEVVTDLLEKLTEKPPKGKAATKRKATNKEPVADNLIEEAEELQVEPEEEDSKPAAKKIAKKEPKEKKPAKETKPRAKAAKAQEKNEEVELENGITAEEKKPKGRKRAAVAADEDEADGAKPTKAKKAKAPLMNSTVTKYNKEDFILPPNEDGVERFNLKIASWNVAGLRSWLNKDGLRYLEYELPDIFCLQEIKCTIDQLPEEVARIPGYHPYWLCMPGGYAGVAIYSKIMPINVVYGIDNEEFDGAGRMITAEYEKFFLINVYVPNSGRKLVNLEARMRWEKLFQEYVKRLDAIKPVVICGDMNVSHQAIDLANPKTNTRSAGFTQEERDKMTELLSLGFVDTFRHLYPERIGAYTYWTYMANARSRNVGWRLDYYIVSERFTKRVVDNCIRAQVLGSDHCPITLFLKI
ncbi:recombination repair protein 1 [Zeugodacus cucurbitae]|uniref:recombination repair protein 1 n=1 Tax=Zeugodacus cucurbitae TaxID=28588 RepID=UPI00059685A9|nr:recombination repair protein 1 [Zeugodacus cucurbitae]